MRAGGRAGGRTGSRRAGLTALLTVLLASGLVGAEPEFEKSIGHYTAPDVTLIDQNGARVKLRELLDPSRPVLVQFIFTSCTNICPVMAATFASFQNLLGPDDASTRLVSISIDPDYDTPARMKNYLKTFQASQRWSFLTGSRTLIDTVEKSFEAWVANKMSHARLTFIWSPARKEWTRISGFIGAADLLTEYRKAQAR